MMFDRQDYNLKRLEASETIFPPRMRAVDNESLQGFAAGKTFQSGAYR
jgi:hypothetical protein